MEKIIEMLRKYLKEWKDEQEYATKYCKDPDSVPNFSWHYHYKELISIQGAICHTYEQADAEARAMLTEEEKAEVKKILSCVID